MRRYRVVQWMMVLALTLLPACRTASSPPGDVLILALAAPFSGEFSLLGQSTYNGVVLAAEEWNQRGGVLGRPVQIVTVDTRCEYEGGRAAAQEAISEYGAQFIVGAICARASEGVAQVASELGVLQITPASVHLDLTTRPDGTVRPYVFRVPFVDRDQGSVAATFALESLGAQRAAILYPRRNTYAQALVDAFVETFSAGQGEIVAQQAYNPEDAEFYNVLQDAREAEPDVIYMPGYYDVANRLVGQARAFGLLQPIIGSDGWDSPALDMQVTAGSYFTTHYAPQEPRAAVQAWIQRYEARYIVPPDDLATMGYDATNVLLNAISRAGVIAPLYVVPTLEDTTFGEAVTGPLYFDALHNPVKPVPIVRVEGGQIVFVDRRLP